LDCSFPRGVAMSATVLPALGLLAALAACVATAVLRIGISDATVSNPAFVDFRRQVRCSSSPFSSPLPSPPLAAAHSMCAAHGDRHTVASGDAKIATRGGIWIDPYLVGDCS
jgi:hypothetical protein